MKNFKEFYNYEFPKVGTPLRLESKLALKVVFKENSKRILSFNACKIRDIYKVFLLEDGIIRHILEQNFKDLKLAHKEMKYIKDKGLIKQFKHSLSSDYFKPENYK